MRSSRRRFLQLISTGSCLGGSGVSAALSKGRAGGDEQLPSADLLSGDCGALEWVLVQEKLDPVFLRAENLIISPEKLETVFRGLEPFIDLHLLDRCPSRILTSWCREGNGMLHGIHSVIRFPDGLRVFISLTPRRRETVLRYEGVRIRLTENRIHLGSRAIHRALFPCRSTADDRHLLRANAVQRLADEINSSAQIQ